MDGYITSGRHGGQASGDTENPRVVALRELRLQTARSSKEATAGRWDNLEVHLLLLYLLLLYYCYYYYTTATTTITTSSRYSTSSLGQPLVMVERAVTIGVKWSVLVATAAH